MVHGVWYANCMQMAHYMFAVPSTCMRIWYVNHLWTVQCSSRRCHEKTSYVSNYAFFTLLYKWGDRGQTHQLEKLQQYTSSDKIGITHIGVFLIDVSALYRPIHVIKWRTHRLTYTFFRDNDEVCTGPLTH